MGDKPYRTTGFSSRFDDTALAFKMKAYEHKEYGSAGDVIWFFSVAKYCNGDDLIRIIATKRALLDMRHFIDQAIEQIELSEADRATPKKEGE